ncbi:MAG: hypothetical protein AAGN46_01395 [Acidobacteriota bacterium]
MRTVYHEFESLDHLLGHRLLPGGDDEPIRFVVFGGTGAVGGASVVELCRLILASKSLARPLRGQIYATGLGDPEIDAFIERLGLALGDDVVLERDPNDRHHVVLDGRIEIDFDLLRLSIPADVEEHVATRRAELGDQFDLETVLGAYFGTQACPFRDFVERLDAHMLHAVVVAIPLPSVATYTLERIDGLIRADGLAHAVGQRIKTQYLQTFVGGLATIQQRYARHVVMAHTTAVGGMYRVDGGSPEIRLGFAHSALGKKLVDKKYFADQLTQLFVDHGFDVLVTAAAIGIDAVESETTLPLDRAVARRLAAGSLREGREGARVVPPEDLESGEIHIYRCVDLPLDQGSPAVDASGEVDDGALDAGPGVWSAPDPLPIELAETPSEAPAPAPEAKTARARLDFGQGERLIVGHAVRSGENGLFSVGNCVALYHVMKVAIPEELAMVLVRHAVFGPERRRDWFDGRICYYSETENSYFALRLLDGYPQLVRAHHGPLTLQAFQALGSATHQARMHELGLLMLTLRLDDLARRWGGLQPADLRLTENAGAAADDALTPADVTTAVDAVLWRTTKTPAFEDLEALDAVDLATRCTRLCACRDAAGAALLLGVEPGQSNAHDRFLGALATAVERHLSAITSLGTPILYRTADGADRVLLGPYAAPLDLAITHADDLEAFWRRRAHERAVPWPTLRDWTVVNNGFLDLRPHALVSTATEVGRRLPHHLARFDTADALSAHLADLPRGSYFTTAGTVALLHRLRRLGMRVRGRRMRLGTRETWKHLFREDLDGRHLLTPGLIETVRMYTEGLGKITGTEALWPSWGY